MNTADTESKEILVSVMMAVYNDVSILPAAIDSVRSQKVSDWELLIMDNSDPDRGTIEILREYEKEDARIHVYESPGIDGHVNVGWPKASSLLLKKAKGKYAFFLAADDMIDEDSFSYVLEESDKHDPDVIWVGNAYVNIKDGEVSLSDTNIPEYRYFDGTDKKEEVYYVLENVYYNSMFHYVKTDFMRKHDIDFFEPYYSDCAAMTAVLCKCEKMVVLDKMLYYLTLNTSQTSGRVSVDFYKMFSMQWRLLREIYDTTEKDRQARQFAAMRVLRNLNTNLTQMIGGAPLRDKYMNPVELDMEERLKIVNTALEDDMIKELSAVGE